MRLLSPHTACLSSVPVSDTQADTGFLAATSPVSVAATTRAVSFGLIILVAFFRQGACSLTAEGESHADVCGGTTPPP